MRIGLEGSQVWVGGEAGAIAFYDGVQWSDRSLDDVYGVNDFWLGNNEKVYVASLNKIFRWDDGESSWEHLWRLPRANAVTTLKDGTFVGVSNDGGIWKATSGEEATSLKAGPAQVRSIAPDEAGGVWFSAGFRGVYHFRDGCLRNLSNSSLRVPNWIASLWDGGDGRLWAISEMGGHGILRDGQWTPIEDELKLSSAWGLSPAELWAVGKQGTIARWDDNASAWSQESSPTENDLWHIDGRSADDIWAVSSVDEILHFDGSKWAIHSEYNNDINALAVTGETVWIGGDDGFIARFEGDSFQQVDFPTDAVITSISASSSDDVWVLADTLYRREDGQWMPQPMPTYRAPIHVEGGVIWMSALPGIMRKLR